jgi:hypothetical protein
MAAGQLVPHQLPDGRTVMVPDYLLPMQPGLAMPAAPAPAAGPDLRIADNRPAPKSPPMQAWDWVNKKLAPKPGQPAQARDFVSPSLAQAAGGSYAHPGTKDEPDFVAAPAKPPEPKKHDTADQSELAKGRKKPEQAQGNGSDPNGGMDPLVRQVFNEGQRGGGGPRRPGALEVGTVKVERTPGRDLLPEQRWALGVEERPGFGDELDPDAEQPTWGNADPVTRKRQTPIERGTEQQGTFARQEFERQEQYRQEFSLAQKAALLEQSNQLDEQLAGVAERRKRVAALQETAEQRMSEAESMEPRTRGQIWEDKGNLARGMAMLAAVLSGAAAGLQGKTGSPAWDSIEKGIDEDVQADRYKAERRMKMGLEAKNDFERAVTLYGDLDVATLEVKQRKTANMMATLQQQLSDRSLDESAKMRGVQVYEAAKAGYMERQQQLYEMMTGVATKEEVNYKQGAPTGGGGGLDTLARIERAARAKKGLDVISGEADKPKGNPTEEAALRTEESNLVTLKSMLARYKGVDTIPGVQPRGAPKRAFRAGIDFFGGEGSAEAALDSDEERANRMIVERAALAYRNKVTGAGGSNREMEIIDKAFAGARTKADLENAVRIGEQTIAEVRRLSGGGASNAKAPSPGAASFRPE